MVRAQPDSHDLHYDSKWHGVFAVLDQFGFALAIIALVLLLTPATRDMARHFAACDAHPFQLDAEEGFILDQALRLRAGETIYPTLDTTPYTVGNYPPLLPWVYSRIEGNLADAGSLGRGRLLIQTTLALCALAIAAIVVARTRRLLPAVLAALLWLNTYEVYQWGSYVRVDFPALMLALAGLAAFLFTRGAAGAALAGLLFLCAVYTRQTMLCAPLACAAAGAIADRRRLAWLVLPPLVLGLLVLAALQGATEGEFWRHIVSYNVNEIAWSRFRAVLVHEIWFFHRWWILAVAAGLLGWVLLRALPRGSAQAEDAAQAAQRTAELAPDYAEPPPEPAQADAVPPRDARAWVLPLYVPLALLSSLAAAKTGAAVNYFLEPLAAGAVALGCLLGGLQNGVLAGAGRGVRARVLACCGVIAVLMLTSLHVHRTLWRGDGTQMTAALARVSSAAPEPNVAENGRLLTTFLRQAPGEIYSEEPIFTLLAGRRVLFQPFIMSQLAREGVWDERPFLHMLRARHFSVLVLTEDLTRDGVEFERYTPAMAQAIRESYGLVGEVRVESQRKVYFIWTPNNAEE
jgi:hypothetical protein